MSYKNERKVHTENVYLYSVWNGSKLKVFEGYIEEIKRYAEGSNVRYRFMSKDRRHHYICSEEEGVIFNKVVWFTKPDEKRAKQVFIEYENDVIEELRLKIKAHEAVIETLKS